MSTPLVCWCKSYCVVSSHRKHEKLIQYWFNVGSASQKVSQHQANVGSTSHVCWVSSWWLCCYHVMVHQKPSSNYCPYPPNTNVVKMLYKYFAFREGRGTMVRARSFAMSLSAVRFRIPLASPFSILGHCFNVVSLCKAHDPQMLHLKIKMSTR